MQPEPLVPLAPPAFLQNVNVDQVISVVFALLFILWALYTLIAIYHWLKYSHASWVAFPAIAAHLFISLAIISYALYGNVPFLTSYL